MKNIKFEYKISLAYLLTTLIGMSLCDVIMQETINYSFALYIKKNFMNILFAIGTAILLFIFLKNHLEKLRNAEQRAQESDRLKNSFLQNISNDIIYPMNAIFNATKHLNTHNNSIDYSHETLDILTKNVTNLSNIVNELIDLNLLQSGDIEQNSTEVNLNNVIDDIYQKVKPQIAKGIHFTHLKGNPDKDFQIESDGIKIKQILLRLINNSIKFTLKGEIQYGYAIKDKNLIFFVKDTGKGIKQETQDKIFNVFHQDQIINNNLNSGIGIGLTICKGYIQVLDGKIWVDSEEGIGSTFFFTVPYKPILKSNKRDNQQLQNRDGIKEEII